MNRSALRVSGKKISDPSISRSGVACKLAIQWQSSGAFFPPLTPVAATSPTWPAIKAESRAVVKEPAKSLAVLVVEDNHVNRVLTVKMLQHLGYAADTVTNGQECLAAMAVKTYDLVLMDLQMPLVDGITAAREIRRAAHLNAGQPTPYICALTANVLPRYREECLAAGMDDFLSKPMRMEALKTVVNRVAEKLANVRC